MRGKFPASRILAWAGAIWFGAAAASALPGDALTTPAPGVVPAPAPVPLVIPGAPDPAPKAAPPSKKKKAEYMMAMKQLSRDRAAVAGWFGEHPDAIAPIGPYATDIRFNPTFEPFELEPPAAAENGVPQAPSQDEQLLGVERTLGVLRAQLAAAKYPEWLYELPIQKYEAATTRKIVDGEPYGGADLKALVAEIEQGRQQVRPDLLPLSYALLSAMSAAINVIFRSQPAGGQVWIITQLRFDVCRAQFKNPYDLSKCTRWREADPKNPMVLAGTYVFQVGWNGGPIRHGTRTVEYNKSSAPIVFDVP